MKQPFKVGDRVAVYGFGNIGPGKTPYYLRGSRGIVVEVLDYDELDVAVGEFTYNVHPKQCRRLVKRERREYWIAVPSADGYMSSVFLVRPETRNASDGLSVRDISRLGGWSNIKELIHVREVRRKK